jgi:hypothetical protein
MEDDTLPPTSYAARTEEGEVIVHKFFLIHGA